MANIKKQLFILQFLPFGSCLNFPYFYGNFKTQKNMKKSLLLVCLLISGMMSVNAQCTITPGCSATAGFCSTPAAGTALPNATELLAYNTTIQVTLGTSASGITINNATVTAVTGLPTGMSYSLNPSSGVIMAGASGCILITGTPAAATAGSYTITAAVTINTSLGAIPQTVTWLLTVNAAAGINNVSAPAVNFFLTPNPAKSEINLYADFSFGKVSVYDMLGNKVLTQEANSAYQTTIDLRNLNTGIYFVQVIDGGKAITRKFIKD
jgi:hypothetical protein